MLKFSVCLNAQGQNTAAKRLITEYFAEFGIRQTSGGIATLSFSADAEDFDRVFGSNLSNQTEHPRRSSDNVGASGLFKEPETKIPEKLQSFIENISISPPARHFT